MIQIRPNLVDPWYLKRDLVRGRLFGGLQLNSKDFIRDKELSGRGRGENPEVSRHPKNIHRSHSVISCSQVDVVTPQKIRGRVFCHLGEASPGDVTRTRSSSMISQFSRPELCCSIHFYRLFNA